jgi:hypothetical protein
LQAFSGNVGKMRRKRPWEMVFPCGMNECGIAFIEYGMNGWGRVRLPSVIDETDFKQTREKSFKQSFNLVQTRRFANHVSMHQISSSQ